MQQLAWHRPGSPGLISGWELASCFGLEASKIAKLGSFGGRVRVRVGESLTFEVVRAGCEVGTAHTFVSGFYLSLRFPEGTAR